MGRERPVRVLNYFGGKLLKTLFVFDIRGVSTKKQNEILLGIFEMSQAEEDGKMHSQT